MTDRFQQLLASIQPVDMNLSGAIQAHLDDLTKPLGSLGRLEEIAMKYCIATGTTKPSPPPNFAIRISSTSTTSATCRFPRRSS